MQRPRLPHPPSPPSSLTVIPQVCWEPWLCVHIDYPAEATVTLPLDTGGLTDVGNIANDGAHKNMQFQEIREEIGQGVGWRVNKGIVRVHCQSRIVWGQGLNEGLSGLIGLLVCLWNIVFIVLTEVGRPSLNQVIPFPGFEPQIESRENYWNTNVHAFIFLSALGYGYDWLCRFLLSCLHHSQGFSGIMS